jgi:nitrate reductase molybdenum cofactor assembly chaperone
MKTQIQPIYRLFSALFTYPSPELPAEISECYRLLTVDYPKAAELINQFQTFVNSTSIAHLEEIYTSTFDVNPVCFPYPGFHLFGENFNRADFLVKLQQKYQEHGFNAPPNELADHLSVMLEFLSTLELRSCTILNNPEAEPPNPRSQAQPGNENIEALPLVANGTRSQLEPDAVLAQELIEDCLLPALEKMNEGFKAENPYAGVVRSLLSFLQSSRQPVQVGAL